MALEKRKGPSALAQPVDDGCASGDHAAHDAKGLAHRADFDIDTAVQAKMIDNAAPTLAQHAFAVGVINHEHDVVALRLRPPA